MSKEDKFTFLVAILVCIVVCLVKPPWSVSLLGIGFEVLFLGIGRIRQRRYYGAAAGWCLAGFAAARFSPRADGSSYSLLFFLGGIATALQGAWELIRFHCLQSTCPGTSQPFESSSGN